MSPLTQWLPSWLKRRRESADVRYQSVNQNVYHCTVQKCASQWIRGLLSDPRVACHSGLRSYRYQDQLPGKHDPRKLTERRFTNAFPQGTIATPIYVDFPGYTTIPKPEHYKTIFVMRDPRDVVVSWYFSAKLSHPAVGPIDRIRQDLAQLSEQDGLLYTIHHLADFGLFEAQRSWADAPAHDPNVLLLRYEDLVGSDGLATVERLLLHCDVRTPRNEIEELMRVHSFEKLSGRARGEEDARAHYRKGIVGDWRNHFDDAVHARFAQVAGDVIERWNYE